MAAILLAGCAHPSAIITDPLASEEAQATVDGETGAIQGKVLDEELAPLAGADITIATVKRTTQTDAHGAFSMGGLPAGRFDVVAQHFGHVSATRVVQVTLDAVAEVSFQLRSYTLPGNESLLEVDEYRGFINCSLGLVVQRVPYVCDWTGNANVSVTKRIHHNATAFIGELEWNATSSASQELELQLATGCWQCDNPRKAGPSPLVNRVEMPITNQNPDANYTMSWNVRGPYNQTGAPLPAIVLQQSFTLYTSLFYLQKAPKDYSARP